MDLTPVLVAATAPTVPEQPRAVGAARDERLVGAVAGRAVSPADLRAAGRLRAQVYVDEKQWLPPSVLVDGCEVDADDARAVPLLIRAGDGAAIATCRVLRPGGVPLPVERLAGVTLDPARRAAECSRLAVAGPWRGGGSVLLALCRLVIRVADQIGTQDLWALIERPLLDRLQMLGFPFVGVSESVRAYRSDNVAAVMRMEDLPAAQARHQRQHGCAIADWFAAPYDNAVPAGRLCGVR